MAKELLVNVSRGEEVRVALVEDGRLEEIYLERDSAASNVGNIYLGKVTNVEGSIQAAFVDFGYGRNGFLHVQDLHPDYFPEGGRWDRMQERVGKKIGRRDRPPIQDCLRRGDQIIVQIIKEGIGTKGPTLTSYPSIPGRFLVMMPGVAQMGVSKNIEDEEERRRLRKVLDGLKPPKNVGFIIRTAGMGKTKAELERDFKYLTRLYEQIEQHRKHARPPALLYSEGDLVTRTVRDVWTGDVERVVCDDPETALRIKQFFRLLMPRTTVNVQLYQGQVPLFHAAGIEAEIETMFSRHVPLPSGGSLVIDSTEAIVAIDVNSGKFRVHDDAEETAFQTDMEAAEEICRQLRLRDLGGVVICDFIDLRYSRHREALFNKLTDLFKRDKAKSRHLPMNEFGIVAITRQRMRPDLKKSVFMPCPWSGGTGFIKTPESMALDVMRRLRVAAADERVRRVNVGLFPTVALHVLNTKRQALADLERLAGRTITIRQDESLAADEVGLELLDDRDGQVQLEALRPPVSSEPDSGGKRKRRRRRRKSEPGDGAAAEQGAPAEQGEASGLIELPSLLELGELKLDAVEELVSDLTVRDAEAREVARKDPQRLIMEALRSGSLYEEEESEAEERPVSGRRPTAGGAAAAGEPEDERGGRRGRRRRRRGRDRDPAETTTAGYPPAVEAGDEDEDVEAHEAPASEDFEVATEPVAPEPTSADGEADRDGRRRRRRRRRGRGGDREGAPVGADQVASTNGQATRAPAVEPRQAAPRSPDRGSPPGPSSAPPSAQEGGASRRGRRRRKGRGMRGEPHGAGQREGAPGVNPLERLRSSGLSDEQLDAHINGNRIPGTSSAPGVYSEQDVSEEDQPAPLTTAAGTAGETPAGERGEGGRRRRRRRRRRLGDGQVTEGPATQEAAAGDSAAVAEAMEDNPSDLPESLIDSEAEMDDSAELPSEDPEAVENDGASSSIEAADEGEPLPAAPVKRAARSRAKAAKKAPTTKKASKRTTSSGTRAKVTSSRSRSPGKKTSD